MRLLPAISTENAGERTLLGAEAVITAKQAEWLWYQSQSFAIALCVSLHLKNMLAIGSAFLQSQVTSHAQQVHVPPPTPPQPPHNPLILKRLRSRV